MIMHKERGLCMKIMENMMWCETMGYLSLSALGIEEVLLLEDLYLFRDFKCKVRLEPSPFKTKVSFIFSKRWTSLRTLYSARYRGRPKCLLYSAGTLTTEIDPPFWLSSLTSCFFNPTRSPGCTHDVPPGLVGCGSISKEENPISVACCMMIGF